MDYLNVMVDNGRLLPGDSALLFGDEEVVIVRDADMYDLLVMLGSFKSRSEARKNWRGVRDIPSGWSEYRVGRLKKELCIWNPVSSEK